MSKVKTLLITLALIFSIQISAQTFQVKVIKISDGDTFTGINNDNLQIKFRIYAIDAPEKKQAFGSKSKDYLSSLIFGKTITVNVLQQDNWGRYITKAITPDGKDVSYLMLINGYAWHYSKYDSAHKYQEAEQKARQQHIGLWSDNQPTPPWEFRKKR